jgi:undecaprenyl-diphosphatase
MAYASYGETVRNGFDWLTRQDASLLARVRRNQRPWVNRLMTMLTRAGEPASWIVHCSLLALAAGAAGWRLPVLLATGVLAATAGSQVLKRMFRRPRPNKGIPGFVALLEDPDAFSFPSGHTAVAFGAATALVSADGSLAAAELAFATAIGCSRVYLGAHYPADVVAGALLGIATGSAAAAACTSFLS